MIFGLRRAVFNGNVVFDFRAGCGDDSSREIHCIAPASPKEENGGSAIVDSWNVMFSLDRAALLSIQAHSASERPTCGKVYSLALRACVFGPSARKWRCQTKISTLKLCAPPHLELKESKKMADQNQIVRDAIHPAIGIARVGNIACS